MITQILFISFLILNPDVSNAQQSPKKGEVLKLQGQVIDVESQKPIKVEATITFETLPYGNDMGVTQVDPFASYEFYLRKTNDYKVQAKAKGYAAMSQVLEPGKHQEEGLNIDFKLKPVTIGDILKYENLQFEQGRSDITITAARDLDDLVATMQMNPDMEIQVEGHTDISGNPKLNKKLSEDRVEEVKYFLIYKGIDKSRIEIKAFGETKPLVTSGTIEDRSINRRVEIRITDI
jgi:OmpA-OmpF porin, OOP family